MREVTEKASLEVENRLPTISLRIEILTTCGPAQYGKAALQNCIAKAAITLKRYHYGRVHSTVGVAVETYCECAGFILDGLYCKGLSASRAFKKSATEIIGVDVRPEPEAPGAELWGRHLR